MKEIVEIEEAIQVGANISDFSDEKENKIKYINLNSQHEGTVRKSLLRFLLSFTSPQLMVTQSGFRLSEAV